MIMLCTAKCSWSGIACLIIVAGHLTVLTWKYDTYIMPWIVLHWLELYKKGLYSDNHTVKYGYIFQPMKVGILVFRVHSMSWIHISGLVSVSEVVTA